MTGAVSVQSSSELDAFYQIDDPWGYDTNPHDQRRRSELLSLIGHLRPRRTLDIGCGNGFVTLTLPGKEVIGVDLSEMAVKHARQRASQLANGTRFRFEAMDIFDVDPERLGLFDLVVITGVLYPQYIGGAICVVRAIIDAIAAPGAVIASCHISDWKPPRLAHVLIDEVVYPYWDYTHLLEVVQT